MAEHDQQPRESEMRQSVEVRSTGAKEEEKAVCHTPGCDWEGYSLEILSLWFDP